MSKYIEMETSINDSNHVSRVLGKLSVFLKDTMVLNCIQIQGLSLVEGETTVKGYSGLKSVDMKIVGIKTKKGYEIGFVKTSDGLKMVYDPWDKELNEIAQKLLLCHNEIEAMEIVKHNMYHIKSRKVVGNEIIVEIEV